MTTRKHTATYEKFIRYFTAMAQLDREEVLSDLLDTMVIDNEADTVSFTGQIDFDRYGHLQTAQEMYTAILTSPDDKTLDGSKPINIESSMTSFGMYDTEISPIAENILKEGHLSEMNWRLTFTFEEIEGLYFCRISGEKQAKNERPDRTSPITGTLFGATVKECMASALVITPTLLGLRNG